MVGELRPPLRKLRNGKMAGPMVGDYVNLGNAFDLSGDWTPAIMACRDPSNIANAIGMLRALAQQNTRTSGFEKAVYVIEAVGYPATKIGVSADPIARLGELQGAHWCELALHAIVFCPTRKSVLIEQEVLRRAKALDVRLRGEWIEAPPEDVLENVFAAAKDLGAAICDGRTYFDNMVQRTKQMHQARKTLGIRRIAA